MAGYRRHTPGPEHFVSLRVTVIGALFCAACSIYGFLMQYPAPDNPRNILLPSEAGAVVFYHFHHFEDEGGAFECADCHHNYDPEEASAEEEQRCRTCHYDDPEIVAMVCSEDPTHPRCVGRKCNECHDGESCTFCHRKQ